MYICTFPLLYTSVIQLLNPRRIGITHTNPQIHDLIRGEYCQLFHSSLPYLMLYDAIDNNRLAMDLAEFIPLTSCGLAFTHAKQNSISNETCGSV